jgi:hypothetical protein
MATALRAGINLALLASLASGVAGVSGAEDLAAGLSTNVQFTNGTSSGQVDRAYYAVRELAGGANETLDLAGVLADIFGNVLTFAKVKAIIVKVVTETDGVDLELGPNAANGAGIGGPWKDASDKSYVAANGLFVWYDPNGFTVTAGTADLLYAANRSGGTTITYRILVLGTSA